MRGWFFRNRQLLLRLVGTLLATGLLVFLIWREWGEIIRAIQDIAWIYLLLAVGVIFGSRFFVAARWYVLLRSAGIQISSGDTISLTFTGLFASNFLPTTVGGDVVRLAGAMQLGFDRAVCLASLAADRLIGMFGMGMVVPLGIFPFWQNNASQAIQAVTLPPIFIKGWKFGIRTLQSLSLWLKRPIALLGALVCTWGHMLCTFWALHILIKGLGEAMPFWLIAGLWSMSYFITLGLPISFNGFGIQEISLVGLVTVIGGLSHSGAVLLALLIRASLMLASLPGAFFLPGILAKMDRNKEV